MSWKWPTDRWLLALKVFLIEHDKKDHAKGALPMRLLSSQIAPHSPGKQLLP